MMSADDSARERSLNVDAEGLEALKTLTVDALQSESFSQLLEISVRSRTSSPFAARSPVPLLLPFDDSLGGKADDKLLVPHAGRKGFSRDKEFAPVRAFVGQRVLVCDSTQSWIVAKVLEVNIDDEEEQGEDAGGSDSDSLGFGVFGERASKAHLRVHYLGWAKNWDEDIPYEHGGRICFAATQGCPDGACACKLCHEKDSIRGNILERSPSTGVEQIVGPTGLRDIYTPPQSLYHGERVKFACVSCCRCCCYCYCCCCGCCVWPVLPPLRLLSTET